MLLLIHSLEIGSSRLVIDRVPLHAPPQPQYHHISTPCKQGVRSIGSSLNEQQIRIPDMLQG
jgi:hypothetical protein